MQSVPGKGRVRTGRTSLSKASLQSSQVHDLERRVGWQIMGASSLIQQHIVQHLSGREYSLRFNPFLQSGFVES